jgi:hypothetical protein
VASKGYSIGVEMTGTVSSRELSTIALGLVRSTLSRGKHGTIALGFVRATLGGMEDCCYFSSET